jgi:hypothetical protein
MSHQYPFYEFWENFLSLSESQRKLCVKETMETLSPDLQETVNSNEWEFIGIVPALFYYDSAKKNDGMYFNYPFCTLLLSHKKLPMLMLVHGEIKSVKGKKTNFHAYNIKGLDFWEDFSKYGKKQRAEIHNEALDILTIYTGRPTEEGKKLTETFRDSGEYRFIGMVPLIYYFRVTSSSSDDLKAMFEHPFSLTTMAYAHKTHPVIILSNANIEYNDTVLRKIKGNEKIQEMFHILGITG